MTVNEKILNITKLMKGINQLTEETGIFEVSKQTNRIQMDEEVFLRTFPAGFSRKQFASTEDIESGRLSYLWKYFIEVDGVEVMCLSNEFHEEVLN